MFLNFNQSFKIPKRIILIGMPGVGKTTLDNEIRKFTNYPLFDTDKLLLNNKNVLTKDWNRFRENEGKLIKEIDETTFPYILSTGGGVVDSVENQKLLSKLAKSGVCIVNIVREVPDEVKKTRILPDSWENLYVKRNKLYGNITSCCYTNDKNPIYFVSWLLQKFSH